LSRLHVDLAFLEVLAGSIADLFEPVLDVTLKGMVARSKYINDAFRKPIELRQLRLLGSERLSPKPFEILSVHPSIEV
jgi:hypothetical protein